MTKLTYHTLYEDHELVRSQLDQELLDFELDCGEEQGLQPGKVTHTVETLRDRDDV